MREKPGKSVNYLLSLKNMHFALLGIYCKSMIKIKQNMHKKIYVSILYTWEKLEITKLLVIIITTK